PRRPRHPGRRQRAELARRMTERAPDPPRIIDRREKRGLRERARAEAHRRHSITRITRRGLDLLERMAPTAGPLSRFVSERLSEREAIALSRLCEKIYAGD